MLNRGENAEMVTGNNITPIKPEDTQLRDSNKQIYFVLQNIGIVLMVAIGGFLGIQFMMASAEDKAQVKEKMIPYVIGCIVISGAFGIWRLVIEMLSRV